MEKKTKDLLVQILLTVPMAMWLVLIPVLVKRHNFINPLKGKPWYYTSDYLSDFFLYYKSKFIVITAIVMIIVLMVVYIIEQELRLCKKDLKIFIPIGIYGIMAIISTIASDYKDFALNGCPDQFEGIFVLMSYLVGMYYFYHVFRHYAMNKIFLIVEIISSAIVLFICVSQFIKKDVLQLIFKNVTMTVAPGEVYGTFYNVDYTAMYLILLLPLFVCLIIFSKKLWLRICSAAITVGILIAIKGAGAITGYLSVAVVIAVAFFVFILRACKAGKISKGIFGAIIALLVVLAVAGMVVVMKRCSKVGDEYKNLEHIYTRDDCVELVYKGNTYYISYNVNENMEFSLTVLDKDKNKLQLGKSTDEDGNEYIYADDQAISKLRFAPEVISTRPSVVMGFSINMEDAVWTKWYFSKEVGDGTYYYVTAADVYDKITEENETEDFGPLVGKNALVSHRGFIWNKAIVQVLHRNLLIGCGPDSYLMTFPNDDYVDVYNNHYMFELISKPHSLYLQMAGQTGLPSAIAFVVFYLWYFIDSLKVYCKTKIDSLSKIMGLGIMLGTFGYMFSGLVNDSSVTAAFLFWGLMGAGIAINRLNNCTTPVEQ